MNWLSLTAPEVILVVCGLVLLLWEAFGKPASHSIGIGAIVSYLFAGFVLLFPVGVLPYVHFGFVHGVDWITLVPHEAESASLWNGMYLWDKLAVFGKFFFLICGLLVTWLGLEFEGRLPVARAEFHILPLFVTAGLLVLTSVNDFILLFVALELVTVAFYILVAFQKDNPVALEAGVKYLIMGALSSAFLVMGIAYVFGVSGSTQFQAVKGYTESGISAPLVFGLGLIIVGLGFKVAAVPFHIWAPDVYQGAPTPITAFLGVGSKAAGFFLLLRILEGPFSGVLLQAKWVPIIVVLSVLSLILGNLAALPQRNLKRLLAYSGISHAGFLLAALSTNSAIGHVALLYYLGAYLLASFLAFMVITVVAQDSNGESIHQFSGLSQRSPLLAWSLAIALVSMAGIPPLSGFFGKYLVFLAVWNAHLYVLLTVAVLMATAGLYYYIGVVRSMFWAEPLNKEVVSVHCSTKFLLVILSISVLLLGLWAQPLIQWASQAF